jgi:uncharacterized protein (DUF2235 family)
MPKEIFSSSTDSAKRIFIFADGTGNAYSTQESNVWRLSQALDTSGDNVVAQYIAGVGTSSFKPWATFDAATGIGVPGNVRELYSFLCKEWKPHVEIYMFGFSRGAFTIRTLIGLIASQGLVAATQKNSSGKLAEVSSADMTKYALAAYRNYRAQVADSWPWWQRPLFVHAARALRKIRQFFYRSEFENPQVEKEVSIKFVGLFDTVEAFGVPIEEMRIAIDRVFWPISFRNNKISPIAHAVRHALSLDDERTSFHPLRIERADGEDEAEARKRIKEVWFAGVHSDVGGGYPDGDLSLVPLLWMVDELKRVDENRDSFRKQELEIWQRHASAYAPRHDSRSTIAILYRYAPRDAEPLGRDGKPLFDPPLVHYSVVERIAFGYDRYAPTPLSVKAQVLLPTGTISEIASAYKKLPPAAENDPNKREPEYAKAFEALEALDGPKLELIESARDKIWRRRIGYFVMLAGTGAFLALPFYADPLSDWLCNKVGRYFLWWLEFWQGIGRALGFVIGAIVPNVAGYVGPYLNVLRDHPAIFLSLVVLLMWFYMRSTSLAEDIVDLTNKAWVKADGDSAAHTEEGSNWLVRKLRTNTLVPLLHRLGAAFIMPSIWAVVLVYFATALLSRLIFEFDTGTNWTNMCVATGAKALLSIPENATVEAGSVFETKNPCWPSRLEVEKGQRYRITLTIAEPWLDRTILTDARGFEPPGLFSEPAFFLARPYLRWAFDPWFKPIIRIVGEYGDSEMPLDFGKYSAPTEFVDGKCVGVSRRYERSSEYCTAHGYSTDEQCARHPLEFGVSEPLPEGERPFAKMAFENAVARSTETPGCLAASRARKIFIGEFDAPRKGELFMFVNDAMPVLRFYAPFYANNLGTAKVTLQRIVPSVGQSDATVATAGEHNTSEGKAVGGAVKGE